MWSNMGELTRQWETAMINDTDRRRTVDRKTYCGHATTRELTPVAAYGSLVTCIIGSPELGMVRIYTHREV